MNMEPPPPGESGLNSGRLVGVTSNSRIHVTQYMCSHQLVHRDMSNAATKCKTQDAHLIIVHKTGCSRNNKQPAVGCEYIHIEVTGHHSTVKHTVGVHRMLRNLYIAAHNRKPPLLTKAFIRTFRKIEYHHVVSTGFLADELPYKYPHKWTKQAVITLRGGQGSIYSSSSSRISFLDPATNLL